MDDDTITSWDRTLDDPHGPAPAARRIGAVLDALDQVLPDCAPHNLLSACEAINRGAAVEALTFWTTVSDPTAACRVTALLAALDGLLPERAPLDRDAAWDHLVDGSAVDALAEDVRRLSEALREV